MVDIIYSILITVSVSKTTHIQNLNIELFPKPSGLVNVEPGDQKIGQSGFLVSFEKRYVANWQRYACGLACDAAGYVIDFTIDFDQIHLFTLDNKLVLLELITDEDSKHYCKPNSEESHKINHSLEFKTNNSLSSHTPYELIAEPNSNNIKVCIKDHGIYFSELLGGSLSDNTFKVLAVSDTE